MNEITKRLDLVLSLVLFGGLVACGTHGDAGDAGADLSAGMDLSTRDSSVGDLATPDLAGGYTTADLLALCPTASTRWTAIADNSGQSTTISLVNYATDAFHTVLTIPLYAGPTSGLGSLPVSTTIDCDPTEPATACNTFQLTGGTPSLTLLSGTLALTSESTPPSSELRATLTGLVFNVTSCDADADGGACKVDFVAGASCPALTVDIDTTVAIGSPCTDVYECGTNGKACDVATSTCQESECKVDSDCGTGKTCVTQNAYTTTGTPSSACYTSCDAVAASSCSGNAECVRGFESTSEQATVGGFCLPRGSSSLGGSCMQQGTNSTGCASGLVCEPAQDSMGHPSGGACESHCDWFAASPGCAANLRCIEDACKTPFGADSAALGQPCTQQTADVDVYCGDDGSTYRGVCGFGDYMNQITVVCLQRCELGTMCAKGACGSAGGTTVPACPF